ncbi:tripartite tricarboxylate transporter substrate-binding protein [Sulfurospirillum arcachonense]|uniref:tripartite tricarboxylate transporter substrate-binding protein n=1 Tax=Sulfurospirillum arcachonense TaxID=57666 RepID=UPI00046A2F3A|nr:tripartite tricarboxylate transporter substrate-binding protein [Sulfurospirillum arcachonense]
MIFEQRLDWNFFVIKGLICFFIISFLVISLKAEESYPNKPIEMIVGFGKGGNSDTLARSMAPYLSKLLNIPIHIQNIPGRGSASAIEAFLEKKADGYTLLCSSFSPYLAAAILRQDTSFSMKDLDFLNIQSYGYDLVAVNEKSKITSLSELLKEIKSKKKKFKFAVVENSNGYLLLGLIFEAMNISLNNIEIHKYNSGGDAKQAMAQGVVDVMIVSSNRSELIREYITPLAIHAKERQAEWDIPTVDEALIPLGIKVPDLPEYMRGFAVQKSLKHNYPLRYEKLSNAFMFLMAKKSVQRDLKKNKIGGAWTNPENSTQILNKAYRIFKKYNYLLDDK